MQSKDSKKSAAFWATGIAALLAALIVAAGDGASAAPVETVLHTFCSLPGCTDGRQPQAGLIADSNGNLYGTTTNGGSGTSAACTNGLGEVLGCGTVFKLSPSGTETVLYSFTGGTDGGFPFAGLIADSSGNLYGTTLAGGVSGEGVVFKLTPSGTETVLYSLTGGSDGGAPEGGLTADSSGNLFGTTTIGGGSTSTRCANGFGEPIGCGVVFKLTPSGTETVLHSFCSLPGWMRRGVQALAGRDRDGAVYL
ncbi:MAG: choice-of-anchor tandem repeat GloVer-containing protein [Methylocella sp.]